MVLNAEASVSCKGLGLSDTVVAGSQAGESQASACARGGGLQQKSGLLIPNWPI